MKKRKRCERCDGTGTDPESQDSILVEGSDYQMDGVYWPAPGPCMECKGEGVVEEENA